MQKIAAALIAATFSLGAFAESAAPGAVAATPAMTTATPAVAAATPAEAKKAKKAKTA